MYPPTATYRLQLHKGFGFRAAADLLDYLHALGISHLYLSPVFKAREGSMHGYDIEDFNQFNPELGDEEDHRYLVHRLGQLEMGWIQDIVPNHMAFSGHNPYLANILECGPRSAYYGFFDIQWDHPAPELYGAVSAPFLGEPLEVAMGKGDIRLHLTADGLHMGYYAHRFPLALDAYGRVLYGAGGTTGGHTDHDERELRETVERLMQSARQYDAQARRQALADAKRALWSLYRGNERIKALVDGRVRRFNKNPFETDMAGLLGNQFFRLRHWKTAAREINYRRFFDINELIGLRQELPEVFAHTHRFIQQLVQDGWISGLRIDHVDGLFDPAGYLRQLRHNCGDIYIVTEKILAMDEALCADWPVQGATGYEFAARMNALFCCPDHQELLTHIYTRMTGTHDSFARVSRRCKAQVLAEQFGGDLNNLVMAFETAMQAVSDEAPPQRSELQAALTAMLIGLPVYRTYLSGDDRPADRAILQKVMADAAVLQPDLVDTLAAIARWLRHSPARGPSRAGKWVPDKKRPRALAMFEQLAAPLTAKGIEDTALYRYNRLAALNEVGGDPGQIGAGIETFHQFAVQRQAQWPHTLNALSTHDTKRSADVRARMLVIAELAGEWDAHLDRWRQCNAAHVGRVDGGPVPDPEMEYLLYQVLAATLPPERAHLPEYRRRIDGFMRKAAREAKQHTSWTEPNGAYEQAMSVFLEKILDPVADNLFFDLIHPFAIRLAHYGLFNALAQCLLQLTAPGIPDIYQGTELIDDSLVDPDNRRPVDFQLRRRCLAEIEKGFRSAPLSLVQKLMADRFDGRIKLFVTWIALRTRRRYIDVFRRGQYLPLSVSGRRQQHVLAFARVNDPWWCVTVVPRFPAGLAGDGQDPLGPAAWSDTMVHLPAQAPVQWQSRMTGEPLQAVAHLALGQLFSHLPLALLIGEKRP